MRFRDSMAASVILALLLAATSVPESRAYMDPPPPGPAGPHDPLPASLSRSQQWEYLADSSGSSSDNFVSYDVAPDLISMPKPSYPPAAKRAGIEGTVKVRALIDATGRIRETRISHSIPALDKAALAAVWKSAWRPARRGGRPLSVWVEVPVRFYLHLPRTPPKMDCLVVTRDLTSYYPDGYLPTLLFMPRPVLPDEMRRIEGVVKVMALVDTFGDVKEWKVVRSVPMLDQVAVDAVKQSKWKPARLSGSRPVEMWAEVAVRFGETETDR